MEAIDFVFSGPGLVSFPDFVQAELEGDRDRRQGIRGVFSRENLGLAAPAGHGAMGQELPIEVPRAPGLRLVSSTSSSAASPTAACEPSLTFETSRGCWWGERSHCTFCA